MSSSPYFSLFNGALLKWVSKEFLIIKNLLSFIEWLIKLLEWNCERGTPWFPYYLLKMIKKLRAL
ncbi:hypothetical protein TMU01_12730 [Tenuibacillus multivorans]|uniref:Uncharacterized protein n=1 Tax=Tenuibacillus multivorans TaxID=237069 RepID=A0A1H0BTV5_9BACI|nr:hypothetical protein TMU01_12730 [Tenuibacillus multivorans]SDN49011.1 hypothetical protein SAMN05216498_2384 [Tenuibacillus multivorans]